MEARDSEENHPPKFASPQIRQRSKPIMDFFDDFSEEVLHRTVLQFYARKKKKITTLDKNHEKVENNLSYPGSRESLRKVLKKIGFRRAKVDGRKIFLENNDVKYALSKIFKRYEETLKHRQEHYVFGRDVG